MRPRGLAEQIKVEASERLAAGPQPLCDEELETRRYDPAIAERMSAALLAYAEQGEKAELIRFAEEALAPVGGRLFEGYYRAGKRSG